MHRFLVTALLGAALLLGDKVTVVTDPTPSPALLILSKADHVLSIVNPTTHAVVAQIPSGPDPHEVAASEDGAFAYISNYGLGTYNTITPVDLVKQKALPVIDLGPLRGPHGLWFAGGKLWYTAEAANMIGSYDPATKKLDWAFGTGQRRTHMIYVSADAKRILTTNVNSATVSIIEPGSVVGRVGGPPQEEWNATVVPVGNGAEGFDVLPNGKEAWIANARDGTVSIIDMASKKVVQTLAADVSGANRLKFTPNGALAFVSTLGGPNVTVLDVATRAVVKRIPVGRGAAGIEIQPDGARAYVACTPDDDVAVIDVKTLAVISRIKAGKQPDGMAWAVRR